MENNNNIIDPLVSLGSVDNLPSNVDLSTQTFTPNYELNQLKEKGIYKFSNVKNSSDPKKLSVLDFGLDFGNEIGKSEVNINDSHINIGGEYYAKTDTYLAGFDNENYDAHNQSTWSKWGNGITKFAGKTAVNVIGGTVGIVNGLTEAVSEGSLSAFYSNDFNHYLDDLNKKMDYSLPNYTSMEERSMSFLESMGTANFWAKDMLDGASFIVGTVATEAIWAMATGGTSLVASLPKYAVRKAAMREAMKMATMQGLKGTAKKTAMKGFAKELMKDTSKMMDIMGASVGASRTAKALTNTRFLFTTSAYEAGMEARHTLDDAITAFDISYENNYGRKPTEDERANFLDTAKNSANLVFAANLPLIAAGNLATIGGATKIGRNINKSLKFGKKGFGLDIVKTMGKDGVKFIKPNPKAMTKILGKTASYLKAPFSEGIIEEGGQSVISSTAGNWLASKYNPGSMKENVSLIDELATSFKHTYGTREGFKEVGIGMLIGFLGHQGSRVSQSGDVGSFFGNNYSQELASQQDLSESLNKSVSRLGETLLPGQRFMLRKLGGVNTINTFDSKANNDLENGDEFSADLSQNMAQFAHHVNLREAEMEDTMVEQAHFMIDNQSDEVYIEQGVDSSNIEEYKDKLKEQISEQYKINKQTLDIAEAFDPQVSQSQLEELQKSGISIADMKSVMALELSMGVNSFKSMKYYAEQIENLTSVEGAGRYKYIFDNLTKEGKRQINKYSELNSKKLNLETKVTELEDVMALEKSKQPVYSSNEVKENAKNKVPKLNGKIEELHAVRNEIKELEVEMDNLDLRKDRLFRINKQFLGGVTSIFDDTLETITSDDLVGSLNKVKELDSFLQSLRVESNQKGITKNRKRALDNQINELEYVIDQYNAHTQAFRTFNENYELRTDVKFAYESYKGLAAPFANIGMKYVKGEDLDDGSESWKRLEEYIESDSTLSEYDKFSLRANHRIIVNNSKFESALLTKVSFSNETINSDIWKKFKENGEVDDSVLEQIALNELNDIQLSNREKDIKSAFEANINSIKDKLKFNKGDSILDIMEFDTDNIDTNSIVGKLKMLINKIKKDNVHLHNTNIQNVDKPTDNDYEKFKKLSLKKINGKLSNRTKLELEDLKNKINAWGRLQGTIVDKNTSLSDLIENLAILESSTNKDIKSDILTSLINIDDMISDKDFLMMSGKNSNYKVMQSYDKVMVSKTNQGYRLHNLSLNGFLDFISKGNSVTVKYKGKTYKGSNGLWNLKGVEGSYKVTIGDSIVSIGINGSGNIIISDKSKSIVNNITQLKIMPSNDVNTKYQPLLINVNGIMKAVSHDYKFSRNQDIDNNAIYNLKEGDAVNLEVDIEDEWNKKLISKYNNAEGKDKDRVLNELVDTLHVYIKDNKNNLLGVLKSARGNTLVDKGNTEFKSLMDIRHSVAKKLISDMSVENQIVDVNIALEVAFIYDGHPNIEFDIETLKPIKHNFNSDNLDNIVDVGYVKDGEISLKNGTKLQGKQIFIDTPLNSNKYKGKYTPIAVINYNGKNIAYPVDLKIKEVDNSQKLHDILNRDINNNEKVKNINKLLIDNNIDVDKFGIMFDTFNSDNISKVEDALKNGIDYANVKEWLNTNRNINDILENDADINIDVNNKPFHSPKIVTKITNFKDVNSLEEQVNVISIPQSVSNKVDEIIDKKCKI